MLLATYKLKAGIDVTEAQRILQHKGEMNHCEQMTAHSDMRKQTTDLSLAHGLAI